MLLVPMPAVRTDLPPLPPEQFDEIADFYTRGLPDDTERAHFFDCLAALPEERRPMPAISVTGGDSTGKGMLGNALRDLWGSHAGADSVGARAHR